MECAVARCFDAVFCEQKKINLLQRSLKTSFWSLFVFKHYINTDIIYIDEEIFSNNIFKNITPIPIIYPTKVNKF